MIGLVWDGVMIALFTLAGIFWFASRDNWRTRGPLRRGGGADRAGTHPSAVTGHFPGPSSQNPPPLPSGSAASEAPGGFPTTPGAPNPRNRIVL